MSDVWTEIAKRPDEWLRAVLVIVGALTVAVCLSFWIVMSINDSYCRTRECLLHREYESAQATENHRIRVCAEERTAIEGSYYSLAQNAGTEEEKRMILDKFDTLMSKPCLGGPPVGPPPLAIGDQSKPP